MTEGTNQGLFVVVAIVIFGIFVGLSYTLFGSQSGLSNDLENLFTQASDNASFNKNEDYNVDDVIPNEESDFIFDNVDTIIGYRGTDTEVIIPNKIDGKSVTTISGDAFNNKGITKLIMPNSLTTIKDGSIVTNTAFNTFDKDEEDKDKNTLTDLLFMEVSASENPSRQVIGAFSNNAIKEISFSANLEYIGSFAFFSGSLEDVVLPEGLLDIGESAFEENLIEEIKIPSTVENLGDNSFKNNLLKDVTYSKNKSGTNDLTTIGSNVFSGNTITDLELPKGIIEIPANAYSNSGLESVTIPEGTKIIGNNAFSNNNLTEVTIPKGVTLIGDNSFGNNKLTKVTIPNTVTKIGKEAFKENLLTEVVIPESVLELDNGSFKDNDLTNVDLPMGLQRIGDYAFYKNKLPIVNLPESLLIIGSHAFEYNELLDVKIPSKLGIIKEWTFAYNKMPKKPTIPTNIKTEEANAFYGNLFDEPIIFTDVNLANALATKLGVETSKLTKSRLLSFTVLDLSGLNISDLTGLEEAKNLEAINVSNNSIKDVTPLINLPKLKSVNISNNGNVNLTPLENLGINLQSEQYDTKIGSISGSLYHKKNEAASTNGSTIYTKTVSNRTYSNGKNNDYVIKVSNDAKAFTQGIGVISDISSISDVNGIHQIYIGNSVLRTFYDNPKTVSNVEIVGSGEKTNNQLTLWFTLNLGYLDKGTIKVTVVDGLGNSTEFNVTIER